MVLNSHADINGHMTMYDLVRAINRLKVSRKFIVAEVEIQNLVYQIHLN